MSAPRAVDVGRKRSGAHANPVIRLVCPAEAVALIDQCCADGESRSEWIRAALALAVARQLKLDEAETASLFEGE